MRSRFSLKTDVMGNGAAQGRARLKASNSRPSQKRRRNSVQSLVADYVSGKLPLSKMMNPSRLTAPRSRQCNPRKAERNCADAKAAGADAKATGADAKATGADVKTSSADAKASADARTGGSGHQKRAKDCATSVPTRRPHKQWPGSLAGAEDGLLTCGSCLKTFASADGGSKTSSVLSGSAEFAQRAALRTPATLQPPGALETPTALSAATPAISGASEPIKLDESASSEDCPAVATARGSDRGTPKLFDSTFSFDYDIYRRCVNKRGSPSRRSARPSLRWKTTLSDFEERQNLLALIRSHENVEQCLVKQIVHLRRERDRYRHAYIDLVKIHKILANRWFQFKKLNID